MRHYASPDFWEAYGRLPEGIQRLADRNFVLLKSNPAHPSLHFKQTGRYWSVRVGLSYRALSVRQEEAFVWFWIGSHAAYDQLLLR